MKVVHITGSFPPMKCGVGDYVERLSSALSQHLERITILTHRDGNSQSHPGNVVIDPVMSQWSVRNAAVLRMAIERANADIIHIHYPARGYGRHLLINIFPLMMYLTKRRPIVITTLHEFAIAHPLRKLSALPLLFLSQRIIVPDERERDAISRAFPSIKSRICVIPVASNIDPVSFTEDHRKKLRESLGIRENDYLLTYFGFISKSKEVNKLVRAFASLMNDGFPAKLLLLSEYSMKDAHHISLHRSIRKYGLDDKIIWTGYLERDEISRHLLSSDIVVLPYSDGVSLRRGSFMASIAHGVPTITVKGRRGVSSTLVHGENVYLMEKCTWQDIVFAVRKVASMPELRKIISNGGKILSQKITWASIAQAHMRIYTEEYGSYRSSS